MQRGRVVERELVQRGVPGEVRPVRCCATARTLSTAGGPRVYQEDLDRASASGHLVEQLGRRQGSGSAGTHVRETRPI